MLTRDQVARHSPGIRVLIGTAVVDAIVITGIVAWNVGERLVDQVKARASSR